MTPILAFDIETVPDVAGIRKLYDLPEDLADREVAEVAFQKRRTLTGSDFLPPHLQKVVVISCVLRTDEGFQVFSIGEPERKEREAIQKFYDGLEKLIPQLVSWNGGGFDLPVMNYRALMHGISAPRFWNTGEDSRDPFRYNNYVNRYHERHTDLMDCLAMYQPRNNAPLDQVAQLAGLPGKIGVGGAMVWETYLAGELAKIRDYCEVDTVNTYLLFLRFQFLRGVFSKDAFEKEKDVLRQHLKEQAKPHWREFLERWTDT
ncbi:MAG TPA: 3'-5' exonuclease [Burkholderiales bacterium]|nr:3'-5' exonuclease [Burkholderiales bacterium]